MVVGTAEIGTGKTDDGTFDGGEKALAGTVVGVWFGGVNSISPVEVKVPLTQVQFCGK